MNYKRYIKSTITLAILFFLVNICFCFAGNGYDEEQVIIKNVENDKKQIAITFDDGPHPKETDKILDILDKYEAKATFFVVGKHVNWYTKPVIRASKEGHEIGNHTYTHRDINTLSDEDIVEEIKRCEAIVLEKTGQKTTVFRPPFGSCDNKNIAAISKKLGYTTVLWSDVDVKDWKNPAPDYISRKLIENTKSGDIILLHDYSTESTVKALEDVLKALKDKGYQFVTISELLQNNKNK